MCKEEELKKEEPVGVMVERIERDLFSDDKAGKHDNKGVVVQK